MINVEYIHGENCRRAWLILERRITRAFRYKPRNRICYFTRVIFVSLPFLLHFSALVCCFRVLLPNMLRSVKFNLVPIFYSSFTKIHLTDLCLLQALNLHHIFVLMDKLIEWKPNLNPFIGRIDGNEYSTFWGCWMLSPFMLLSVLMCLIERRQTLWHIIMPCSVFRFSKKKENIYFKGISE